MSLMVVCAFAGCRSVTPSATSPRPTPTATVVVTPAKIAKGEKAILGWRTANATSVSIAGIGEVASSGSREIEPAATTNYILTALGGGGSTNATATLEVAAAIAPPAPPPVSATAPPAPIVTTAPRLRGLPVHPPNRGLPAVRVYSSPVGGTDGGAVTPAHQVGNPATPPAAPSQPPQAAAPAPETGTITNDTPPVMTVQVPVTVDVAVQRPGANGETSPPGAAQAQNLGLNGNEPLSSQTLPVSDEMVITLRSEETDAFTVTPPDTDIKGAVRGLEPGDHAEWHWTVTPNASGKKHLLLHSMFIAHMPDGSNAPTDQGTFETTITVQVLPWYNRAGGFIVSALEAHWAGLLGWLVPASAGSAIWQWWRTRRKRRGRTGPAVSPGSD